MPSAPVRYQIRLLGPCVVEANGARLDLTQWPAKAATLLRLLATVREHRLTREEAIELLWPEVEPEAGISNLKGVVYRLRRVLGEEILPPIVLEHGWVLLNPACSVEIDADQLQRLADHAGDDVTALEEAASLSRGEPLLEDRYEDGAMPAREYLQRRWREVGFRLVRLWEARGERDRALFWAHRLREDDPLDEEAVQSVLRLTVAAGRRSEARRIFQTFEERLRAELGTGPAAETRALVAPPGNLPSPASSFVGRKQDLAAIGELLDRADVRLVTLTGPGGVGKTRLALEAARAASDAFPEGIYLVSLAALRDATLVLSAVARGLDVREEEKRPIGVTLASAIGGKQLLLVLDNVEHLLPAAPSIADLLAACPHLTVLVTGRTVLHLSGEHVYCVPPLCLPTRDDDAAPEEISRADAVALFFQRARAVRPDLGMSEETARTVAEICRRLEGLPLAIELAAPRVRFASPATLLSQLTSRLALLVRGPRDLPERQRTLRDTIAWSYELLDEPHRRLFVRLSVFAGGWTVDAARAVCDAERDLGIDVAAGLEDLLESNLVRWDAGRYQMLETIREWAAERLDVDDRADAVRRAHAEYFLSITEETEREPDSLDRLAEEQDNLRSALSWSMEQDRTGEIAVRLAGAASRFWSGRWHLTESRRWLGRLLEPSDSAGVMDEHPRAWAHVLTGAADQSMVRGDIVSAGSFAERAATVWQRLDDAPGLASALRILAWAAQQQGDHQRARRLLEEVVDLSRTEDGVHGRGWALYHLARTELQGGNLAAARGRLEACLALAGDDDDVTGIVQVLCSLAEIAWLQGDRGAARGFFDEALARVRSATEPMDLYTLLGALAWVANRTGDYSRAEALLIERLAIARAHAEIAEDCWSVAWALNHLGDSARCQGNAERARSLYEESLTLFQRLGEKQGIAAVLHNLGHLALSHGETDRARALFTESLVRFRELNFAWGVADCLMGLAGIAGREGRPQAAALLYGAAEAAHKAIDASGTSVDPANQIAWEREMVAAQSETDAHTWQKAWAEGQTMSLEKAVCHALQEKAEARG